MKESRVLILSVETGHGHNQVGNAMMEELLKHDNVKCEKIDTFKYINKLLGSSLSEGYLIATKYTPKFYGKFYKLAEKRKRTPKLSVVNAFNALLASKLDNYLEDFKPHVTICTHVFAARIISMLKDKTLAGITTGIITDFTIHPYWEETKLDYYITPNEFLTEQAVKKGLDIETIKPLGIPVYAKFFEKLSKEDASIIMGFDNKPTVLLMSGSMGYGNMIDIIEQLDESEYDFQIASICGNNLNLKNKIDALKTKKKLHNFGFVNNIDTLMDACDCIITKPGGITVSESLVKHIPMILTNPIPGQEERNAEFLAETKTALIINNELSALKAVEMVLFDTEYRQNVLENLRALSKPNAAQSVCELILT